MYIYLYIYYVLRVNFLFPNKSDKLSIKNDVG